ncbi:hypothetical protein [Alkalinema sp. FACHB-956]|uniref:hypothetical protein n=1 Tax=Alkalinema sp. FACHB-956 TaxID=2692768 RepID=UPI00168221EA|nr:hypothetical protein [Alkalinema sp. FACHB-956]MBD2327911.1 hypothetical protein [Alkalinema sp. FACHB-956]
MMVNYREKITALWVVFLLGLLFHTQLALMPLFHGLDVAHSHAGSESDVSIVFWLMLVFFLIPMAAIVAIAFTESYRYRVIHFGVTVLYSILNFFHVVADLMVQPIVWSQILLMVVLFLVGLLLNLVAYQWLRSSPAGKLRKARDVLHHS